MEKVVRRCYILESIAFPLSWNNAFHRETHLGNKKGLFS